MRNILRTALASAAMLMAVPSMAQMMTAADVGVSPMTDLSATDYVKMAADSDNFEIQSGHVAEMKSKRMDVKSFAKQMVTDHTGTSKALMAGLNNQDRKITMPSMKLSADNQAKLDLLKKAPKANFDDLYIKQQLAAHQSAWSVQKGYADNGTDATLKQIATTAVPVVESHLTMLKGMAPAM